MVLFVVFITGLVWLLANVFNYNPDLIVFALLLSTLMSFGGFWWSDKIILTLSGARPADRQKEFNYYTVAENLAMAAQLPMPKLYVLDDSAPNAFATGRDPQHAAIVVTTGLLQKLNRTEIEGVVAHELSHIKNYDIRLMGVVTILVGSVTLLADWFLHGLRFGGDDEKGSGNLRIIMGIVGFILILLSPIIAQLIQLTLSRRREYFADAAGAFLTRYPEGLASALEKISADTEPLEAANKATAHLYITDPLKNNKGSVNWFAGLFNTHPPIAERIRLLRQMV